jgi:hypothetical protein
MIRYRRFLRIGDRVAGLPKRVLRWLVCSNAPPALIVFVVYLHTLAPGVTGLDSAELATGAFTLGIVHPTGYPLYLLLGKLFTLIPIRSVAYRLNLMSAVFAALTVWLLAHLVQRLTRRRWAAWLGAGALGFSTTFWGLAVVAEVYTLHTFLLALVLALLERWQRCRGDPWLVLAIFVYGLSLTNHVSSLLFAPAIAWLLLRHAGPKCLLRLAPKLIPVFMLGLSLYLYLPLRDLAGPINYVRSYYGVDLTTVSGLWWMVSGKAYRLFAFAYDLPAYLAEWGAFVAQLWRDFTPLGALFGLVGFMHWFRNRHPLAVPSLLIFLATVAFFAGYGVVDKSTMFLPAFFVWALWLAIGAVRSVAWLSKVSKRHPSGRRVLVRFTQASLLLVVVLTGCLNVRWVDRSDHYGPEAMARQVLESLEPGAMVVGYWSSAVVLEYFQSVEGLRPDVEIFNRSRFEVAEYYRHWKEGVPHPEALARVRDRVTAIFGAAARSRPLYGVEYDPMLANQYEYKPMGAVFHLVPRN